tara:strand:+ start:658 stop:900 length:243 start_codon:yes stop_codon:yes gene_type:complete
MKRLLLSLFLISSFLFSGISKVDSLTPGWTPPDDYREDDSLEIVMDDTEEIIEEPAMKDEISIDDLLGSEQVFPFEPGFS